MTLTRKILLAGVAVGMTVLGLLLAVYVVGPAVRRIFGAPLGFREHFTSPANFYQALVVQAMSLALAFFVFGIASERLSRTARYADAVWIANPATVGFGFVGYKGALSINESSVVEAAQTTVRNLPKWHKQVSPPLGYE